MGSGLKKLFFGYTWHIGPSIADKFAKSTMSKNDIKLFIDFFHDAAVRIRKVKPVFNRGKDGNLVKNALTKFSRTHLEMLAVWFLAKKTKLQPKIGAMLSKSMTEELERTIQKPTFWKELDEIHEKYYPKPNWHEFINSTKK